ncbi:unnamed protein product, partial [Porites lobata]
QKQLPVKRRRLTCEQDCTERVAFCYYVPTYPFSNQKKKTNVANSMEKSEEPWLGMETTGNNDFKWIDGASLSATFSAWTTGEPNNPGVENCPYM